MNAKVREHLLAVLIVVTFLSACAAPPIAPGDALPLQPGYTNGAIGAIEAGANNAAKVLTNPANTAQVYAWPGDSGTWCFAIRCDVAPANVTGDPSGQMVEWSTMSSFIAWLQSLGWSMTTPVIVPVSPETFPDESEIPQS